MQVEDGLSRLGPVIHDQTALRSAVFPGQLRADPNYLADERFVFTQYRVWATEMFLGNNQKVRGCLRADVPEGEDILVFVQLFGRYFSGNDLTEKTGTAHPLLLFYKVISLAQKIPLGMEFVKYKGLVKREKGHRAVTQKQIVINEYPL
jgi:hypothetical protein